MTKLSFEHSHDRPFNHGLDRCVIYTEDAEEVWRGLYSIESDSKESSTTVTYVDGLKTEIQIHQESFSGTLSCFVYPDLALEPFNLTYRTYSSEDRQRYSIHLLYNCKATPGSITRNTLSNQTMPTNINLLVETKPVHSSEPGFTGSSHFIVSGAFDDPVIVALEEMLYGTDESDSYFPTIDELVDLLESLSMLRIIDHGDGTWTARELGGINAINLVGDHFTISWPSARMIESDTYRIHSL